MVLKRVTCVHYCSLTRKYNMLMWHLSFAELMLVRSEEKHWWFDDSITVFVIWSYKHAAIFHQWPLENWRTFCLWCTLCSDLLQFELSSGSIWIDLCSYRCTDCLHIAVKKRLQFLGRWVSWSRQKSFVLILDIFVARCIRFYSAFCCM